ncbi:hypothetical protein SAMN05216334_10715 [Nitrosomonas ureae]|uniref:Uncharacterized protein n=1 Tax=Nitrosomonas ureae TaxID=44577 RepID=A0A1H5U8G5_9PROT|nr:hypothetical protein SAMN05216334_10715 [Nitrosomonas ureae]
MIVSSDHFLNMYDTAQTTISIVAIVAVIRMVPDSLIKTICYRIILLQHRFKEISNRRHFKYIDKFIALIIKYLLSFSE